MLLPVLVPGHRAQGEWDRDTWNGAPSKFGHEMGARLLPFFVLLSLNSYYMHIFIIIIIVSIVRAVTFVLSLIPPKLVSHCSALPPFATSIVSGTWCFTRSVLLLDAVSLTRGVRMEFGRVLLRSSQLSLPLPPALLIIYWVFYIKYIMHNRGYLLIINSHEHNVAVKLLGVRWRHTAAPF